MKMRFSVALGCLLMLSVTILFTAPKGDAAKGKALYVGKCVQCHGEKGEGKPAIAKMFNVTMKPLPGQEVQSKTDDQLTKSIVDGNGKMKPVKLTGTEAADVVAFLRTLAPAKK